jgi:hypothetical protein
MLAFDSNLAPIVGQQVTLDESAGSDSSARLDLLEARAAAGECDVVAHGLFRGDPTGLLFDPASGSFLTDRSHHDPIADARLRALAGAGAATLTFTAVPPGTGRRIGIDRDLDGVLDGDAREHALRW